MQVIKKIKLSDEELNSIKLAKAVCAQICTELNEECAICPLYQCSNDGNECVLELMETAINEMEG